MQLSGISAMTAASFVHPVDTCKIRLQLPRTEATLKYKSVIQTGMLIAKEEGLNGIYKGLSGSLLREGTYSAMRLGFYEPCKRLLGETDPSKTPVWKRLLGGAMAGFVASGIANPADLLKTRMQSQLAGVSKPLRWHIKEVYTSTGSVAGFYKGTTATMLRATILNAVLLGCYDTTKHTLKNSGLFKEGIQLQFVASVAAGFWVSVFSSPADNVKTSMMTQRFDLPASPENPRYKNIFDCGLQMFRREGSAFFYKGFLA